LPSAALAAAVTLAGLEGFDERFARAMTKGRALFKELDGLPGLGVTAFEHGSNIFPLCLDPGIDRAAFAAALAERDVVVATDNDPPAPFLPLTVNTTIARQPNDRLVEAFAAAASAARTG